MKKPTDFWRTSAEVTPVEDKAAEEKAYDDCRSVYR